MNQCRTDSHDGVGKKVAAVELFVRFDLLHKSPSPPGCAGLWIASNSVTVVLIRKNNVPNASKHIAPTFGLVLYGSGDNFK